MRNNNASTMELKAGANPLFHGLSGRDLLFCRDFNPAEFKARRQRMQKAIGPQAHLLVAAAPPTPGLYPVQDAVFYYFCGLEVCHSFLLMDGDDGYTTLFLPSRDAMAAAPENRLGFEDADLIIDRLGVDAVRPLDELEAALKSIRVIYTPFAAVEGGGATRGEANNCARRRWEAYWDGAAPRHQRLIRLLEERIPGVEVKDASPLVDVLRRIKSPAEIDVLRQAGELSALTLIEAMKATEPGLTETRLQAIAEFVFRDQGYCSPAYNVIAAVGTNSWDGHYHRNNTPLSEGELVIMDCGPDLRHYTSDIARVWPVSGTYSKTHRPIYGFIAEYHKTLLRLTKPGVMIADIYEEADRIMAHACKSASFPYGDMSWIHKKMLDKKVSYLNHPVGLSVHDPAGDWKNCPLEPGFVVAVDPMVWYDEEQLYIRVEDTVVVTSDGNERLTGAAPFEPDDIEELMKQPSRFGV